MRYTGQRGYDGLGIASFFEKPHGLILGRMSMRIKAPRAARSVRLCQELRERHIGVRGKSIRRKQDNESLWIRDTVVAAMVAGRLAMAAEPANWNASAPWQ